MFQHPQRIKKIIRESPSIILPSPTGSTHVPTAIDVPRDGYQYVPNPVEQSNKMQQAVKRLGEIKTETEANSNRRDGKRGEIQKGKLFQ